MSFANLSYDEKRLLITSAIQKMAVLEIRAIEKTPWLDVVTSQSEIAKAKAAYQLVVKIFAELDLFPAATNQTMVTAWHNERHLAAHYIAMILRTTKAKDLRLAKLAKISRGVYRIRMAIDEADQKAETEAEKEIAAQDIIEHTNMAIGFIEFTVDNSKHLTALAAFIWNKSAAKLASRLFNKPLSRLNSAESKGLAERLAPLLQKVPGVERATLMWLKQKNNVIKLGETRAALLNYDLFAELESVPDSQVVKVWLEPRMLAFVKKLGDFVGPAGILLDIVTVVLDTVDEVDRWASTFIRSATTAYAAGAMGVLLSASMQEVGQAATIFGGMTAEMSVMEAALVSMATSFNASLGAAAATSELLPLAGFCLVTGIVVVIGIAVEALVETLIDVFFGPEHIPAGLRGNYATPISTPHMATLTAPMRTGQMTA